MGCREIPLNNTDKVALVDEEDYPVVSRFNWWISKQGRGQYAYCSIYGSSNGRGNGVSMHKLVMGTAPKHRMVIDHINHNELDNRKENLRWVSFSQNAQNRRDETIKGFLGVRYDEHGWSAAITRHKKTYNLGRYETAEKAARAYDRMARLLYGPQAKVNFPDEGGNSLLDGKMPLRKNEFTIHQTLASKLEGHLPNTERS